jgi:hypothetical protein
VSKTNSVQSSDSNCPSSIKSNDTHYKKSNGHRHFKIQSLSLTPLQFENRLRDRLPNDVIQSNLSTRFKPLSISREKYILPLSEAYPGQEIELTTISNFDYQRFLSDYVILFVEGWQVKRKVRNLGEKEDQVLKDTKQEKCLGIFSKIFGEYLVRINFIKIIKSWDIKYVLGLFTCNTAFDIDGYAVYFGNSSWMDST